MRWTSLMEELSKANMKHLLNNQQVYSDSTMNKCTKAELIKYIRMCEKNINALSEQVENQYQLLLKYTDENNKNKSIIHAHWKGYHTQEPYCSNCGFTYDHEQGEDAQITDYCGNCGAKMDENEVENLKRCSCGDRYYCPEVEKDENGKWFIRCHMCCKIVWGNTIEEAANAWNEEDKLNKIN